jgi:biopolymer transport protein ExbD
MATHGAPGPGPHRDINVVPMLDVLLVLLVIFMVLAQARRAIDFQLPPLDSSRVDRAGPESGSIVLQLLGDGSFAINRSPVSAVALERRLREIYLERPVKLLFLQVAPGRKYQEVIDVTVLARRAGVQVFGFVPPGAAPR